MNLPSALQRFRSALAHWGPVEYAVLATIWLALSIPLVVAGWGFASLLGLPLFLLSIALFTVIANSVSRSKAAPPVALGVGFPSELIHPELGTFPLSQHSDERYERTITWCGKTTQLSLSLEAPESIEDLLRAASSLVQESLSVNSKVEAFVVGELLPRVRKHQVGSPALESVALLQRITLEAVTIHADRTYEFLYNDGELLGGHWIEVYGHLEIGPTVLDTPG